MMTRTMTELILASGSPWRLQLLREAGIASTVWLPLACDPAIHRPHAVEQRFDLCFVGKGRRLLNTKWRNEIGWRMNKGEVTRTIREGHYDFIHLNSLFQKLYARTFDSATDERDL